MLLSALCVFYFSLCFEFTWLLMKEIIRVKVFSSTQDNVFELLFCSYFYFSICNHVALLLFIIFFLAIIRQTPMRFRITNFPNVDMSKLEYWETDPAGILVTNAFERWFYFWCEFALRPHPFSPTPSATRNIR